MLNMIYLGIFFGHTHEDQLSVSRGYCSRLMGERMDGSQAVQIFYANNATNISAANAQTVAWVRTSSCQFDNRWFDFV